MMKNTGLISRRIQGSVLLLLLLWIVSIHAFVPSHPRHNNHRHPISPSVSQLGSPDYDLLTPWETWCVQHMETWYRNALSIKCPFMRRRSADFLDGVDMLMRFLVIRHKSLDLVGPPPAWRCEGQTCVKTKGLSLEEMAAIIRKDWREDTKKGYYITGRLNTTIYRDDCLFDGPDPDMPVKGLRKYLDAASQLFEQRSSYSELLDLRIQDDVIVADWRLRGVLMLPWRPALPEWTGTTTYHRDKNGLIYRHSETWDMSVAKAFLHTLWPALAERIWSHTQEEEANTDDGCVLEYSALEAGNDEAV